MQWFRFYNEVLNDPKVQCLPGDTFKAWVNILCLASQNDGVIPSIDDVTFALRLPLHDVTEHFDILFAAGLIDEKNGFRSPHNWKKRQFKSDTSNERVKRHRDRYKKRDRNVTVTPPDTEQIQIQNRADSEQTNGPLNGSLGQHVTSIVKGIINEGLVGGGYEGKVIKLDRRNLNDLFKKYWNGSESDFRQWLEGRDGWYAGQAPVIQKNWLNATVKKLMDGKAVGIG
jgi:hypothetical protein